jgi:uncharacterized protein with PIN domain
MLGTLATWLRLLGYDARYCRALDDDALVEQARREGRVLVTRDRELARRRAAGRAVLIRAQDLSRQWVELARALRLRPRLGRALSRCAVCNRELEPLARAAARPLVPPYVHATRRRFRRCPGCGRVFWRATHLHGISRRLRNLVQAAHRVNAPQAGEPRAAARRAKGRRVAADRAAERRLPRRASAGRRGTGRGVRVSSRSGGRGRRARRSP